MRPSSARALCRTLAPCLLGAAGAVGCAPASQRIYVAPTVETVVASLEEARGDLPAHLVWVENRSTVPVKVYSVTLRSCENVRQPCEPRPVDISLAAGQRRMVMRVEPRSPNQGFSFRYSFAWRPAEQAAQ